jgi:hypothetical protein
VIDADFADAPTDTTILGAAKVTGKVGRWSIGVLDALTDVERGDFAFGSDVTRHRVEPMTNYFVTRETKELGGNARVGFMLNSVDRRLPNELSGLREHAVSGGIDGYAAVPNRDWIFEWFAAGSRVAGSAEAIEATQESPSRYYQRPDADHIHLDPTRTSLAGWAGKAMISKQTGDWRPNIQVQAYSPGFETNDAGFMQRTDYISSHAIMQYVNQRPSARFRERNLWLGVWHNGNFDGDTLERGVFADHFATLANYWTYRTAFFYSPGDFNDRQTRGGPLVQMPWYWSSDQSFGSDDRKKFSFLVNGHLEGSGDHSYVRSGSVRLSARPSSNLLLSIEPSIDRSHDHAQYLDTIDDPAATATYGKRYVFADLEQRSFQLATRVDWTLTPRLSFQLYMQPFIASGDFHDPHALAAARTRNYVPYGGAVDDPDFNFRSVRASGVMRWELRPGSALYVVWNENRADSRTFGDFRFRRDLRGIAVAPSHDVFLIKMSYWLPM